MAEFDAETLADQAVLSGLLTRAQVQEAMTEAPDGSVNALTRVLLRKGMLTSWQRDKLFKGDVQGFFYGPYRVLFHIAEGTFARVYRGQRTTGGKPVAIKVMRKRFSTDAQAVARFTQEAEAGMRLVHPNIVRIYEAGEVDRNHFMVMEYVEGSNLRDFLKIRHRLEAAEALPILLGMARGLQYSHNQGVTHRDIKGTNILVSNRREAKLVDFGLATVADDKIGEFAHTRTVDYSALERTCRSPKGDPRSDIYFLGCVFYQVLTGVLPMPEVEANDPLAKMLKRSFGAIKPLREMRYAPDERLCQIIEKMMAMSLEKRYRSMDQVVADLEAYQNAGQAGETAAPEKSADQLADELFSNPFHVPEFKPEPRNVLCVEVQEAIQQAFKKALTNMGYQVLLVKDAEHALERYREEPTDVVVYDIDGLGPEALGTFLTMYQKARENRREFSALVLLGPRQGHLAERLPNDDRLAVLTKPIKMKDVQDALQQLVPISK